MLHKIVGGMIHGTPLRAPLNTGRNEIFRSLTNIERKEVKKNYRIQRDGRPWFI